MSGGLLPVADALARLLALLAPVGTEEISVRAGLGRVLAAPLSARLTQPPWPVSAMDGWAVRHEDALAGITLREIGAAPAGRAFDGLVGPGEAVRISTGAPVPGGADTILILENADADGERILVREAPAAGRHIRPAGQDFRAGDPGPLAGRRLTPRDLGLAAAMNHPWLVVRRRPRVAILSTGDEIVRPGEPIGPHQIVSANGIALAALVEAAGADPLLLPIAADDRDALSHAADQARGADLIVTSGGASVGGHDLVREGFGARGLALDFWRIAMRPGKPLMVGRMGDAVLLGLPGNPVSTMICALLFLHPALDALLGLPAGLPATIPLPCAVDLPANDMRQDYLRARLLPDNGAGPAVEPFSRQDSALIGLLARCDALIERPPFAPAISAGSPVSVIPLTDQRF